MADLPRLLLESLDPNTRKRAEQNLYAINTQPGFLLHLLQLVLEPSQNRAVRLAGGVYLKNITKLRWEEVSRSLHCYLTRVNRSSPIKDVQPLPENDKATLRDRLIPAMITLSGAEDKAIRAQIAESVALIAELDFPTKWPNLIDVSLVCSQSNSP